LSAAALETLAIVAYRQPIGRAEIEEIRGVGAGQMLKSLHERELIEVVGRGEGMGRPLLYGTTPGFLEQFALRHLGELPRADELAVALRDPNAPPPSATPIDLPADETAAVEEFAPAESSPTEPTDEKPAEPANETNEISDSPYASVES
jgi:hypothetical protein